MFPIASQTAGLNGLKFFKEPMGIPGVTKVLKKILIPDTSTSYYYVTICVLG